jgi:hypothetical protein
MLERTLMNKFKDLSLFTFDFSLVMDEQMSGSLADSTCSVFWHQVRAIRKWNQRDR